MPRSGGEIESEDTRVNMKNAEEEGEGNNMGIMAGGAEEEAISKREADREGQEEEEREAVGEGGLEHPPRADIDEVIDTNPDHRGNAFYTFQMR